jgi:DNA polymerase-3 subunit delta
MNNYFIQTDDYSLVNNKLIEIKNKINDNVSVIEYDLSSDSIYNIIDEIKTISMFDEIKFIKVKNAENLENVKGNSLNELLASMNDEDNKNYIVFISTEANKSQSYDKVKKLSNFISLNTKSLKPEQFILKSFEDDGYKINNGAVMLLLNSSPTHSMLNSNIEILKCYKCDEKTINEKDILDIISRPLEDATYNLVNQVLLNNKKKVFQMLDDLRKLGVKDSQIIYALQSKFIEMYDTYILAKSRFKEEDLMTIFGVSRGRAYYMLQNVKGKTLDDIKIKLNQLNKLDYNIKSGKIKEDMALELYLLR